MKLWRKPPSNLGRTGRRARVGPIRRLTVLYDPHCMVCLRAKRWLAGEPAYVQLEFLAAGSTAALRRYPTLTAADTTSQLTVVADDRGVYRGDRAFVMCLWALRSTREWALRLARVGSSALARRAFLWFSGRRPRS